jgi:hypothetical protein
MVSVVVGGGEVGVGGEVGDASYSESTASHCRVWVHTITGGEEGGEEEGGREGGARM